jgi:hypothetical protein
MRLIYCGAIAGAVVRGMKPHALGVGLINGQLQPPDRHLPRHAGQAAASTVAQIERLVL